MALQPSMFPEIEGPDFVRSAEVADVGATVLRLHGVIGGVPRLHPIAEAVDQEELRILWLMNEKPFDEDTEEEAHGVAGKCVKAPRLWHDITGYDFAIWIRKHFWNQWDADIRRAAVLHELLHIEVKRDKDGQARPAVRKHDVEDFVDVVRQYGPIFGEGPRLVRAAALHAGEPEPILTRKTRPSREVRAIAHDLVEAVAPPATRADLHDQVDAAADDLVVPSQDTGLTCVGSNHVPGCEHTGRSPRRGEA